MSLHGNIVRFLLSPMPRGYGIGHLILVRNFVILVDVCQQLFYLKLLEVTYDQV